MQIDRNKSEPLKIQQFFNKKITIELQNGRGFQGYLSKIDRKNKQIVLEQVKDLGNSKETDLIPFDQQIAEKKFSYQTLEKIILPSQSYYNPNKEDTLYDNWGKLRSHQMKKQDRFKKKYYNKQDQQNHNQQEYNPKPYYIEKNTKNEYYKNRGTR